MSKYLAIPFFTPSQKDWLQARGINPYLVDSTTADQERVEVYLYHLNYGGSPLIIYDPNHPFPTGELN